MLAPFFRSVTLSVSQTCLPVLASRQMNSPDDFAENTWSPCNNAVEVLLKILREEAFVSGQRTLQSHSVAMPTEPERRANYYPSAMGGFAAEFC